MLSPIEFIRKILKNKIFWYLGTRYATFIIQFINSIYIAVKLGAYYFGIWSFILLLVNIIQNFNLGIGNAINILLVQNKNDQLKCNQYIVNAFVLMGLVSLIPIIVICCDLLFGIPYFAKYHLGSLIYPVAIIVILYYFNVLFINIYRVKNRLFEIAVSQSLFPILTFGLMFFAGEKSLLYLLSFGYVMAGIISLFLFMRGRAVRWNAKINSTLAKEIVRKGSMLFIYNASFYFIVLSTKTIVSYFYEINDFGYFSFAFSLAFAAMLLVESFVFLVFPKMIDMLKGNDNILILSKLKFFRDNYITTVHGVLYFSIAAYTILLLIIPQYSPSYKSLVMIILTLVIYSNCFGFNSYMLAQNYEKVISLFSVLTLGINIGLVLFLVLILKISFDLCIIGTMISYLLYSVCIVIFSMRKLGASSWKNILISFFPPSLLIPFVFSLALALTRSEYAWISLLIFLPFNARKIISIIKILLHLCVNPSAIDVK